MANMVFLLQFLMYDSKKNMNCYDFDKYISRGENQKGVSDISPTLQESQNKKCTIV